MQFRVRHFDFAAKLLFFCTVPGLALIAFWAGGVDFRGYYGAAELVLRGGNPYDYSQLAPILDEITGFAGNNPYFYPPWFALFFIPLTFLEFQSARLVWALLNVGLLYASMELLLRLLEWRLHGWRKWSLFLLAALMFGMYCLRSEQAGFVLLLGLVLCLLALKQERPVLAGFAFILLLTKPQVTALPALLILLWMVRQQRKTLVWSGVWLAGLMLVATLAIPQWWQIDSSNFGQGLAYELDGPQQVMAERVVSTVYDFSTYVLGIEPPLQYAIVVLMAAAGLALLVVTAYPLNDLPWAAASAFILNLLITPYALQYDYVPLILPLFLIFNHIGALPQTRRYLIAALLFFAFTVVLWQEWSYQGYLQLLAMTAAFAMVLRRSGVQEKAKGPGYSMAAQRGGADAA